MAPKQISHDGNQPIPQSHSSARLVWQHLASLTHPHAPSTMAKNCQRLGNSRKLRETEGFAQCLHSANRDRYTRRGWTHEHGRLLAPALQAV